MSSGLDTSNLPREDHVAPNSLSSSNVRNAVGRHTIAAGSHVALRSLLRGIAQINAQIEDSLLGDILGVITLFLGLYGLLLAAPVIEGALK